MKTLLVLVLLIVGIQFIPFDVPAEVPTKAESALEAQLRWRLSCSVRAMIVTQTRLLSRGIVILHQFLGLRSIMLKRVESI